VKRQAQTAAIEAFRRQVEAATSAIEPSTEFISVESFALPEDDGRLRVNIKFTMRTWLSMGERK
jgi:hypothetical protein